jgi:ABC-type nitrate/sulfonate/bicarbonate transport system permease component
VIRLPFLGERSASERLADRALAIRTLLLVCAVLVWDLVVRVGMVNAHFLAAPGDVLLAAVDLLQDPVAQTAFANTGGSIVTAFLIGTGLGIVVAGVMGASALLRRAYLPPVLFILSTPKSIFLPIFVLIWGISGTSAAAFGAFEAFFYVVVNVLGGLGLVEDRHLQVARAFRANMLHRYLDVVIPSALPGFFAALWYGIKHAFLGVMIAQLWASRGGIGDLIRTYSTSLRSDYVLAIVLLITLVAVLAGAAWTRAEEKLTRWRGAGAGGVVGTVPS